MDNLQSNNNPHPAPITSGHQTVDGQLNILPGPRLNSHAGPYLAQQLAGLQDQTKNPSSVLNRHLLVGGAASSNVSLLLAQQQEQLYHQQRQQEQLHLMMSLLQGTRTSSQQNSKIIAGASSGNPNSHLPNRITNLSSNVDLPYNLDNLSSSYYSPHTSSSNGVPSLRTVLLPNFLGNNSDAAASTSIAKTKKKRKKKNKNQRNRPSRPLSAYNLFFKDERKQILASFSNRTKCDKDAVDDESSDNADGSNSTPSKGIGFENLAKTIGRRWKKITPERLEHYKALAKKDQDRYAVDMKAHEKKLRELWSQEQVANKKKKEKEEGEKAKAEIDSARADESKDTPVPRPIEPASQHEQEDGAKGDIHEEYPRSNSNKRSRDEDLTISIDHGAIGADTFKNKKLKAEAPQQPSSQAHLSSGPFLQTAATPSPYSDGINPAVVAMLLASSGQRNINANTNQTGMNDFDMNTRMAVNQLEDQIQNLLQLKNQMMENIAQQQLLQGRLQQNHSRNDLMQSLAQQQLSQELLQQSQRNFNNAIGNDSIFQNIPRQELQQELQAQHPMNNNSSNNQILNAINTGTSNSELLHLLETMRSAPYGEISQEPVLNTNTRTVNGTHVDQLVAQRLQDSMIPSLDAINEQVRRGSGVHGNPASFQNERLLQQSQEILHQNMMQNQGTSLLGTTRDARDHGTNRDLNNNSGSNANISMAEMGSPRNTSNNSSLGSIGSTTHNNRRL